MISSKFHEHFYRLRISHIELLIIDIGSCMYCATCTCLSFVLSFTKQHGSTLNLITIKFLIKLYQVRTHSTQS